MAKKSVAQKMYIKPGMQIGFYNAPKNVTELLGSLPNDVETTNALEENQLDLVLAFIDHRSMLESKLSLLKDSITDNGALWIAYHKGTSNNDTNINRDSIYNYAQSLNLKGVSMVSIDNNWSGFRFKKI